MVADKEFAQGWRMALEDINQAGGVLGRPVQVVPIKIAPGAPVPNVIALFDPEPDSAQALLTSRQAAAWQLPYLVVRAPSDRLVWQEGNRYTFRLAPSSRMRIAALAPGHWPCDRHAGPLFMPLPRMGRSRPRRLLPHWRPSKPGTTSSAARPSPPVKSMQT
ncbi:periplasmic binding family protein [Bordetella holmesii 44057]|nr:periplasmic binding family protein [Bordetella holmesii ATCC 51541]AIT25442.1 periplasmic binding family protein [Bordetella holmesii 44057]